MTWAQAKKLIDEVREYMKTQARCPKCDSQFVRLVEGTTKYTIYTCVPCKTEFKVTYGTVSEL